MSLRILCIEDEAGLREDMELELEHAGYAVECAADGLAGIVAIQSAEFSLVLCDVQVPLANGLEVLAAVAELPDGRVRPPFFMLTAFSDPNLHARCTALGAARVLTKPVDYTELMNLIAGEIG